MTRLSSAFGFPVTSPSSAKKDDDIYGCEDRRMTSNGIHFIIPAVGYVAGKQEPWSRAYRGLAYRG